MSRSVTLGTGWARTLTLLAVATLLAGLATVTTSAVAPRTAFALASCNASYNPPDADRIQVSFTNIEIGPDGSGIYLDPETGKFYTAATSADDTNLAPSTIDFVVTSGSFTGSDIWCVLVNKDPVGSKTGNNLDTDTEIFLGSTALAGFAEGDEVCITAMISAATGKGAPKNRACFDVGRHTTTTSQTANLLVKVTTNPGSSGSFAVTWNCGNGAQPATVQANQVSGSRVASGITLPATCTVTPVSGPAGEDWTAGSTSAPRVLVAGDNTITVSFSGPSYEDPCVTNPSSCGEVLAVVTEKPATAPPTDGLAASTSSTIPALGVLLLILAAVLGTIGWFTPATKRIRR